MSQHPGEAGQSARLALTKIIATVGPATSEPEVLLRLIESGVNVFRLNFSHGDLDTHAVRLKRIREAAATMSTPIAVLGDLTGPKIRVAPFPGDGFKVETGASLIFAREGRCEEGGGENLARVATNYAGMIDDVQPGHRVLINDGAVRMLAVDKSRDELRCSVTVGGTISSGKGVNLPDSDVRIQSITEKDWACVQWAVDQQMDFLALSFVRSEEDVERLKRGIADRVAESERRRQQLPVIAKIELPRAVQNIEGILDVADGIMVARGDLGVEMDIARLPVVQKQLVRAAQAHGKPCIVATQMLESMIHAPSPTRAETTDVANAIFDGADAVMLSGETAVGSYPVLAVDHMRRISAYTEEHLTTLPPQARPPARLREARDQTAALAHGVWTIAQDIDAHLIVVWSQSGRTARILSQNRFGIPIIAATTSARAARQMQILRGVTPVCMKLPETHAQFTFLADALLLERGWAKRGDAVVVVAGWPLGEEGTTNRLELHRVGATPADRYQFEDSQRIAKQVGV